MRRRTKVEKNIHRIKDPVIGINIQILDRVDQIHKIDKNQIGDRILIKGKKKDTVVMTKISDGLNKSFKKKTLIRLITSHPKGDSFDGIVLYQTANFVTLASIVDFEFNGLVLISSKFIRGIRDSKFEKCYNRIIKFNKSIDKVRMPGWVKGCFLLEDVLRELERRRIWPSVEVVFLEDKTENNSAFYLGPIQDVNSKEFLIYGYDADGSWEKCYKLQIDEIFKIAFYDRYTTHFNKFMEKEMYN